MEAITSNLGISILGHVVRLQQVRSAVVLYKWYQSDLCTQWWGLGLGKRPVKYRCDSGP